MADSSSTHGSRRRRSWLVGGGAVACALALTLGATAARAAGCQAVSGKMTLVPVTGAECTSPVSVCATGEFKGGITGTLTFVGTSVTTTADTPTTGAVLVTGDNTIATKVGALHTKDAIVLRTTGAGEFAEVDTIVGGTDAYAAASGVITGTGSFSATTGGEGRYSGEICLP